jgi:hypothetical protein
MALRQTFIASALGLSFGMFGQNVPVDFEPNGIGANWNWVVFENDYNPPLQFVQNPDTTGIKFISLLVLNIKDYCCILRYQTTITLETHEI